MGYIPATEIFFLCGCSVTMVPLEVLSVDNGHEAGARAVRRVDGGIGAGVLCGEGEGELGVWDRWSAEFEGAYGSAVRVLGEVMQEGKTFRDGVWWFTVKGRTLLGLSVGIYGIGLGTGFLAGMVFGGG